MSETMRREIDAQPEALAAAIPQLRAAVAGLELDAVRLFAGGCGDSWYAAGAVAGLFEAAGVDFRPVSAMELACYRRLTAGDRCLLISISGHTRRTIQAARRAAAAGARTLAVTRDPESPLAQVATAVLPLPYRPISRLTPHTLDYAVTLAALAALAERLVGPGPVGLGALPEVIRAASTAARGVAREVAALVPAEARVFVLGAGPGTATAAYGAAKLHEAGGCLAVPGELENMAHGLNFCLEPADLVVLLATDPAAAERAAALVPGMNQLAGTVLVIGKFAGDVGACAIDVETTSGWHAQLGATIALQELCFALAVRHGLSLELPRAGRPRGRLHDAVQKAWMTSSPMD